MRRLALVVALASGCAPSIGDDTGGDDTGGNGGGADAGGGGVADADPNRPDAPPPPENAAVYAHSAGVLYRVDPDSLVVSLVGPFQWSTGVDQMTDIAIDGDGNMIGISFDTVYRVDSDTAKATKLADLDRQFNGLSFVPAQEVDPSGPEILVAAATDGSFYQLDPLTGASTPIGNYGGGMTSSGDIVSVSGFGTVATIKNGGVGSDKLARVDASTGAATLIGETGFTDIWGLGFWGNKVFGFTSANQFVLVNVTTGEATLVETGDVSWWGAGVTTSAPVIE